MMIKVLCVGKIKEKFYRDAVAEYAKRLTRYCKLSIIEVADEKTPDKCSETETQQILEKEAIRLRTHIKGTDYVIALTIDGRSQDSVSFAKHMESLAVSGKSNIVFVIGGSLGLHNLILCQSNEQISFSAMTFPHQLMRVILLEQVYRGFRILNHEPYHK